MLCPNSSNPKSKTPSVHFTLRSTPDESAPRMYQLWRAAKDVGFAALGPLSLLAGDDVAIIPNDPMKTLKLHARGLLVHEEEIVSYMPTGIVGFEALLPNGEKMAIGLCEYPDSVTSDRGIELSTGMAGRSGWMSFARTLKSCECDCCQACIDSHHALIRLLEAADNMDILKHVRDPFGYWGSKDEVCLRAAMDNELCSH
jgi:hypothetical protein